MSTVPTTPGRAGAIRLFRLGGIDVFLHWTWFIVAWYEIQGGVTRYQSRVWNAVEYLALFLIVTLHEFGHSLACRHTGGSANQIVLWPLGGVAYVDPPQRPGATLRSIAAGPLVNVALIPVLAGSYYLGRSLGLTATFPDAMTCLYAVVWVNAGLLIFNLLPIYPLDGGQILRSLLWFFMGRARSLTVVTVIGFLGVAGLLGLAILGRSVWIAVIAAFVALNCWRGLQRARALTRLARLPRHQGFACPSCRTAPPIGPFWVCGQCQKAFDTFETHAACPHCGAQFGVTQCLDCGARRSMRDWVATPQPGQTA
jgi:Zn-dependent protease